MNVANKTKAAVDAMTSINAVVSPLGRGSKHVKPLPHLELRVNFCLLVCIVDQTAIE